MSLCLAAGAIAAVLAIDSFTLAWEHSVERFAIEEEYRVSSDGLTVIAARIKGSGAGYDPPAGAVLENGWWNYRPAIGPRERLVLARSGMVPDWRLCAAGACRPLAAYLPGVDPTTPVTLTPCQPPPKR
jgi:hypothetical protein